MGDPGMTLKIKVPLIAVLLCLTSCALIGVLAYVWSRDALVDSAVGRLQFIAETKRDGLARTIDSAERNLDALARGEAVFQGTRSDEGGVGKECGGTGSAWGKA